MRKGIILAGGHGSRLYPLTFSVTKQLLPIYDKPMIYYSLSILLELDIKEILLISTRQDQNQFKNLLGDGTNFGIKLSYEIQENPNGIAEGLIIAEKFLSNSPCVFILGDNLFIGANVKKVFKEEFYKNHGSTIFTYQVKDPERYGIVSLDKDGKATSIIEKPKKFISNQAITGIYFYDKNAPQIAKSLKPSERGELEITDVNRYYLSNHLLKVISLNQDITWLDAGTISSLYEASNFVETIEKRTGRKISCLEEIALETNKINLETLIKGRKKYRNSEYGIYLDNLINKY
tara:strand:- start:41 stop:913 length:873 start_codon:yes stop_codon:yes gene_type:complete